MSYLIYRVIKERTNEPQLVTYASFYEQACDLARVDRMQLRDNNTIDKLERHEVVFTKNGKTHPIEIPH